MLIEFAIGDAYGSGFEFSKMSPEEYEKRNNLVYRKRSFFSPRIGYYTDDTQMSLAISEAIVYDDPWTPLTLADRFLAVYKRDPRRGYSKRFASLLEECKSGQDFLNQIFPIRESSGAAMRSAPIGTILSIEEILEKAEIQAKITHNNEVGIKSSQAAAMLIKHAFSFGLSRESIFEYLNEYVPSHWFKWEPWDFNRLVPNHGVAVVRAAATIYMKADSMSDALKRSVAFTGDVDTVASLALCALSIRVKDFISPVNNDLPSSLYESLEDQNYGKTYLLMMDNSLLMTRFAMQWNKNSKKVPVGQRIIESMEEGLKCLKTKKNLVSRFVI